MKPRTPAELLIGKTLAHYEILELLGTGGMGQVYRARDTKLGRDVALKVLPPEFAADSQRLERFEREARVVAGLDHPNIVVMYSIEEATPSAGGGDEASENGAVACHFLTMQLVEGNTLDEVIPNGGLTVERFFDIAVALADAISAAHKKGVLHRDLKPSNVMVTNEGAVKVLDFGLAKLVDEPDGADAEAATVAAPASLTEEGKILGTVAYMSPEQAEGSVVDQRSDVFALGILLYEMATGERPFTGDTRLSVMSSIVKDTPTSVTDLNRRLPRHLGRIIKHALEKKLDRRYQTALDLRNELEELREEFRSDDTLMTGVGLPVSIEKPRPKWGMAVAALAVVVVVVAGWLYARGRAAPPGAIAPSVTISALATAPAREQEPTISPDGSRVVYGVMPPGSTIADLYEQRIGGSNPRNLTNTPDIDEEDPAFSPDGSMIAFRIADGGIHVMDADGGNVRQLTELGGDPSWSPDGQEILYGRNFPGDPTNLNQGLGDLFAVDLNGEIRRVFEAKDNAIYYQPELSPNGRRIAFWGVILGEGAQRDIWTISADGSDTVAVTADRHVDFSPVWSPDGRHLYFGSDRGGTFNIWRVPIDQNTGAVLGEPEGITVGGIGTQGGLSISADGKRLVYDQLIARSHVVAADFDAATATVGSEFKTLSRDPMNVADPQVSPDGRWVSYRSSGSRHDIYVAAADGSAELKVTDDTYRNWYPRWLGDSETILFYTDRGGSLDAWSIRRDGSGLRQLTDTDVSLFPRGVSPDGLRFGTVLPHLPGVTTIFNVGGDMADAEILPQVPFGEGNRLQPTDWSPDGEWLAGDVNDETAEYSVLYSVETGQFRKLSETGRDPYFVTDSLVRVFLPAGTPGGLGYALINLDDPDLEPRQITLPSTPVFALRIASDLQHAFFVTGSAIEQDIWLLEIDR